MKITKLKIENFRSFKEQEVDISDYSCFIGANSSGKSTVINALNLFFRENKNSQTDLIKLSEDDFHHKNTNDPIKITVTFGELTEQAKEDLAAYVRQDELTITAEATYDADSGNAVVKQYGQRKVIAEFASWFSAQKSGVKVVDLKTIYDGIKAQSQFSTLANVKTKADMESALREFEEANSELCTYIPSEDQFYGASKGSNRLAPHIQWVFIPATKDISKEAEESKNSALGILLDRTVRSQITFDGELSKIYSDARSAYNQMLAAQQSVLKSVSASIEKRLKVWSKPDIQAHVKWNYEEQKTIKIEEPIAQVVIGDNGYEGELARFGHGMQRSYIFALLQELVNIDSSESPKLLMAIEEPELYQHPPQVRYLAETLFKLSEDTAQVLLCSHSPYFVPSNNVSSIRMVRETGNPSESIISRVTYQEIADKLNTVESKPTNPSALVAKVSPTLSPELNEMFFSQKVIFVEGVEDVSILTTYMHLMGVYGEFRRQGGHIVPVHGKSEILRPLCIARLLDIPTFVLIDGDTNKQASYDAIKDDPEKADKANFLNGEITKHKKDNGSILKLCGQPEGFKWPTEEHVFLDNITIWKTNITDLLEEELGEKWKGHRDSAVSKYGQAKGLLKNPLAVSHALELAWDDGQKACSLVQMINLMLGISSGDISAEEAATEETISEPTS
ncbi:ATP-dependent endonuclease [Vibrio anguillarum]|uniref:ATP-dependent nuclease n=1 Tax=Vibrio anguillarum TaxID=55601 RepID=UPI0003042F6F|nr:AAA family ATPase [Vibrio anguillarum]OEF90210.1 ATP-dependent endonuclease [Vibrio anguillarum]